MKEQRKRILRLVEEGKLSAEEALSLIEALEKEETLKEEKMTALSTEVLGNKQSTNNDHESADHKQSIGNKLMDWVDSAVKKVKDMDLDLNFGKSIGLQHIFQFQGESFQDIDIQLSNGSVTFEPWSEKDTRVECDIKVYRVENTEQARETFLAGVDCQIEGNRFIFFTEKKTMKINLMIKLPEQAYEQVKVKLFNGPIRGEDLKVEEIKAKTANGVVSFSSLHGAKGEFETANGQIKLSDVQFDSLEMETISGHVQFNGSTGKLDAQSFNGNVQLKLSDDRCETLYAKTATGNIDITVPEESTIVGELKSNLGSLSAQLKDVEVSYEKNETIQKELKFRTAQQAKMSLFADSKTGSIEIK
ncbi:DUF4097 domain-containing protein [Bacillus sp. UMB0899]|uniref:DUF4097 family beta strand repeat-containing protein n=1 Tax=Metabacillus schmidteae TaxID=2730405 RepID=UPI000C7FA005|nr:DUF4097 domain-containing protein [Metabacillus schmidteae]PMC33988.1 DUF4097 domain-containing protein [Bacillus sp. UMB0899]